jgi:hypothetical protein
MFRRQHASRYSQLATSSRAHILDIVPVHSGSSHSRWMCSNPSESFALYVRSRWQKNYFFSPSSHSHPSDTPPLSISASQLLLRKKHKIADEIYMNAYVPSPAEHSLFANPVTHCPVVLTPRRPSLTERRKRLIMRINNSTVSIPHTENLDPPWPGSPSAT